MNRISFTIFVTTLCNMECRYCYEKKYKKMQMSFNTAQKAVEFIWKEALLKNAEIIDIRFHGGEPLLAFDIMEYIVLELNSRVMDKTIELKYSMTTNATLYKESMNFILSQFSSISVSVDGRKKVHDASRVFHDGTGSYDITVENIKKMLSEKFNIIARMTISKDTYKDIFAGFISIMQLGIDHIEMEVDFTANHWTDEAVNCINQNIKKIADYIFQSEKEGKKIKIPLLTYAKEKRKNAICDGGILSFTINPAGEVYPCTLTANDNTYLMGQLGEDLNTQILEKIKQAGTKQNEVCTGCARYDYCSATRCKLINKLYSGDFYKPTPAMCLSEHMKVEVGKYYESLYYN